MADIYIATGDFDKAEEILKRAEEEIGTVSEEVEKKQDEVKEEKKREEQLELPSLTEIPSPTPTNTPIPSPTELPTPTNTTSPAPVAHAIYDGTTVELSKAKVGDVVLFGSYEQDNIASNGAEAIPWYVLDKDGDNLLLLSVYLLDHVKYHEEYVDITWEDCTLRQWMNDDFYNSAFTASEKKYIRTSYLENADNPWYGAEGGNDTEDKVFALSLAEAGQYLGIAEDEGWYWVCVTPELSTAQATAYAEAQGAWVTSDSNGWWWLRLPGLVNNIAADVNSDGDIIVLGDYADNDGSAARPALWLNLNP